MIIINQIFIYTCFMFCVSFLFFNIFNGIVQLLKAQAKKETKKKNNEEQNQNIN